MKLQVRNSDEEPWRTIRQAPITPDDLMLAEALYQQVRFLKNEVAVDAKSVIGHIVFPLGEDK